MASTSRLITGITGQDGAYLTELLLSKGYEVHGIKRRASLFNTDRIDHLYQDPHEEDIRLKLHYGDLTDSTNLIRIVQEVQPDEIYNLAAMSHVQVSFDTPEYTADVDGLGTLRLLEAIRILGMEKDVRFYQASTSELYGNVQEVPQSETTPFYPRSPYGVAKLYSFWIVKNYREAYDIHASNGILFNHESSARRNLRDPEDHPGRGQDFTGAAGLTLHLGNLDAQRDWGHAKDYVEGMWRMLQQDHGDDYVLATGRTVAIRSFVDMAFAEVGIELDWTGEGVEEKGIDRATGATRVAVDPATSGPRGRPAHRRCDQGQGRPRMDPDPHPRRTVRRNGRSGCDEVQAGQIPARGWTRRV